MRQLSYLVSLDIERHFAKAANACHVSQPALSAAIRQLEQELGVKLVERNQKFIGFTEDGTRILQWARQALTSWESLRQEASISRKRVCGTLRIGVIPTTIPMLAKLTEACFVAHPGIHHMILSLSNAAILNQLDNYEIDIGLTYLEGQNPAHFKTLPLFSESYYLVRRKDLSKPNISKTNISKTSQKSSAFNAASSMSWAQAANLPLCLLVSTMQNRRIIDTAFENAGVIPNVVIETDSVLALYAQIIQEAGQPAPKNSLPLATILSHSLLALFEPMAHCLDVFALKPELSRSIGLVTLNSDPLSPMVSAVWQIAQMLNFKEKSFEGYYQNNNLRSPSCSPILKKAAKLDATHRAMRVLA